jgi:hypothetical protein
VQRERVRAKLASILRGRRQPARSADVVELADAAKDARAPYRQAEKRPTTAREQR